MSFRSIGKFGFVLVVIGFLMPIVSITNDFTIHFARVVGFPYENLNGFQIAQRAFNGGDTIFRSFIYACFILAVIGIVSAILSTIGKKLPRAIEFGIEWTAIIFPLSFCIIIMVEVMTYNSIILRFAILHLGILHSGFYLILIGSIIALISQFIPNDLNFNLMKIINTIRSTRKCPFCANDVKIEAIICQFCGKDLPTTQSESSNIPYERR